jgi:predicted PurR-regulated permease PerM
MAIIIAALYLAREVLIPFVLSLLLCFLLAPMVTRLRRWGLGRITAVAVTVLIASGVVAAVGSFFVVQMIDVTMRLPEYQSNIETKIESLRVTPDGPLDRAIRMFTRLNNGLDTAADVPKAGDAPASTTINSEVQPQKPVAIQIVQPTLTPVAILRSVLGTALSPLAMAGIVFVLVIFMLIEREALRNRLIRAIGTAPGQLNTTTQALDDAARRVSRYLLMQLIVNVAYGIPIGIGLYLIGVPNAALWGMLAIVLRFIPYVGPCIAAFFPIALAFSVDPGWGMVIKTLLLFAVIEIISNNFIEPRLYGTSMGISSVAILLSALFWAWLWGPLGLLMSMPLTVCFVVLGRYIPALHGLSLMLGDQPGLPLYARMYQRFLAMDPDEPDQIAQEYLAEHTVEEFFGQVLVPTLRLLEDERHQESLDPARRAFVLEHIRELIEDVADHPDPAPAADLTTPTVATDDASKLPTLPPATPVTQQSLRGKLARATQAVVVCIPAHDESDEIVALMISILLWRRGISASVISAEQSSAERIERLDAKGAPIACVSVLPPYAIVYARHTVQRIHARLPGMKIVVGFWEASAASTDLHRQLTAVGAAEVVCTVTQAVESLIAHVATESDSTTRDTGDAKPVKVTGEPALLATV